MKIGKYEVHIFESGSCSLDGGAVFGVIPKTLWEKSIPSDAKNRVKLATRNLLLVSDSRKILIDTGMGNKWDQKYSEIYGLDATTSSIESTLNSMNVHPEEITDVLFTHLHFDHAGGATKYENGRLVPAFPNARYYIQENNFRWAMDPTERDRRNYLKENFEPLAEHGVLIMVNDDVEMLDDEIEIIRLEGHTHGQQVFRIFDSSQSLLFSADFIPTASHIPLPFIMGFDLQPLVTLQEKKNLYPRIVDEDWTVIFDHDPVYRSAKLVATEKGYEGKIVSA